MIALGLRLTLYGGREAAARLAVTVAAMAVGVSMLLITLASMNAISAQNARSAWLNTAPSGSSASATASGSEPLWWLSVADQFGAQQIDRFDVAATGSRSPVPPGIPHLPGPGQFYASPALVKLLRTTPADELADRFPEHQIGTIGTSALPTPNSLIIIVGSTVSQLSHVPGAGTVSSIQSTPPPATRALPPASTAQTSKCSSPSRASRCCSRC